MNVSEVMTRKFEVVDEQASLVDAMHLLRDNPLVSDAIGIQCVVVEDRNGRLVGVLTQSDVVEEILFPYFVRNLSTTSPPAMTMREGDFAMLGVWASKVAVRDVMTRCPVTVSPDTDVFDAADTLVSRKVKSLPVIEKGKVVGIVYRSALYRRIAEAILAQAPKDGTPIAVKYRD